MLAASHRPRACLLSLALAALACGGRSADTDARLAAADGGADCQETTVASVPDPDGRCLIVRRVAAAQQYLHSNGGESAAVFTSDYVASDLQRWCFQETDTPGTYTIRHRTFEGLFLSAQAGADSAHAVSLVDSPLTRSQLWRLRPQTCPGRPYLIQQESTLRYLSGFEPEGSSLATFPLAEAHSWYVGFEHH